MNISGTITAFLAAGKLKKACDVHSCTWGFLYEHRGSAPGYEPSFEGLKNAFKEAGSRGVTLKKAHSIIESRLKPLVPLEPIELGELIVAHHQGSGLMDSLLNDTSYLPPAYVYQKMPYPTPADRILDLRRSLR